MTDVTVSVYTPTRTEHLQVRMDLNKSAGDRHAENLKLLLGSRNPESFLSGDTLKVTYDFYCHYLGNVEKCLRAVSAMCADPGVVVNASIDELNFGESVLISCVDHLRRIQQDVRARTEATPPAKKPSLWQRLITRWQ